MNRGERPGASFYRDAKLARPCPDCLAETGLGEQSPGVYVVRVMHDEHCPTYRRIVSRRARGAS